jgi:hypothetical protein
MDRERVRGAITTRCFNCIGPSWTGVKSFNSFVALIGDLDFDGCCSCVEPIARRPSPRTPAPYRKRTTRRRGSPETLILVLNQKVQKDEAASSQNLSCNKADNMHRLSGGKMAGMSAV